MKLTIEVSDSEIMKDPTAALFKCNIELHRVRSEMLKHVTIRNCTQPNKSVTKPAHTPSKIMSAKGI